MNMNGSSTLAERSMLHMNALGVVFATMLSFTMAERPILLVLILQKLNGRKVFRTSVLKDQYEGTV